MQARITSHTLRFTFEAGTSRGTMKERKTWFLIIEENGKKGIGECAPLPGLSLDNMDLFEEKLQWTADNIDKGILVLYDELMDFPAIRMGLEMAIISLRKQTPFTLFENTPFSTGKAGIPINGLIWMGDQKTMKERMQEKIKEKFTCIKMKIGAIELDKELAIIEEIRDRYEPWEMEIRVDANGAFDKSNVWKMLDKLAKLEIHSIEQPIAAGQLDLLAEVCMDSPIPVALDEELIGVHTQEAKEKLIRKVLPDYIVLKPSLLGGLRSCEEWIKLAENEGVGWWVTSALESNVGLNAIAQWISNYPLRLHQGLGTGGLYENNIKSPLSVKEGRIFTEPSGEWDTEVFGF